MKCTNCGNEVPEDANVCGYCGHRLKANAQVTAPPPAAVVQTPASPQSVMVNSVDRWKSVLLWTVPVCLIQFAGTIVVFTVPYLRAGGPGIGRQGFFSLLDQAFQWGYTDLNTQALVVLFFFGIPCGVAGYLVTGDKTLQRWATGGLAVLYAPFFILFLTKSLVDIFNPQNLFLSAVYSWGIFSGFGPLVGALVGLIVKKFSH